MNTEKRGPYKSNANNEQNNPPWWPPTKENKNRGEITL